MGEVPILYIGDFAYRSGFGAKAIGEAIGEGFDFALENTV